jgi:uncharacterized protein (TIGR02145 family)
MVNQIWMAENLKTTKLNDGTNIPLIADNTEWTNLSTPGYCWYNNDISNKEIYGALYNDYAVYTGKLCPVGWHVSFYGGGCEMKETGTTHWIDPNYCATNESGFTALPGGRRESGSFENIGEYGFWWINLFWWTINPPAGYAVFLLNNRPNSDTYPYPMTSGFSVRCVKDN